MVTTLSALKKSALAVSTLSFVLIGFSGHAADGSAEWAPLWIENVTPTKGSNDLPADLDAADFQIGQSRDPASYTALPKKKIKALSLGKRAVAEKTAPAAKKNSWPASASEGFEFRVRNKAQISSMWVMKRGTNYDLVFATSGGSRVNVSIPPEQFHALKDAASQMRSPASDTTKCSDSNVQLKVVNSGASAPHQVSACLNSKGRAADQLRMFSAALSSYVR